MFVSAVETIPTASSVSIDDQTAVKDSYCDEEDTSNCLRRDTSSGTPRVDVDDNDSLHIAQAISHKSVRISTRCALLILHLCCHIHEFMCIWTVVRTVMLARDSLAL